MMRVIYIAGKFRGATPWQVQQNVRAAEGAALAVWRMGLFALCPHKNTEHFDKELPDDVFVEGTKEMLRRCDAVLLVPGWTASVGALGELAEARRLGLPVFGVRGDNDCDEAPLDEALSTLWAWARGMDAAPVTPAAEWRDRCAELERQLAEIVGALGLEVRDATPWRTGTRVPAESLAEARRVVGAEGESVLSRVLSRIDRMPVTLRDFLGAELYELAAATAGGKWATLLAERRAELEAEEADDDSDT